ncbi:DUF2029 domain-containing protein [Legionella jordanis]|uniref:glycosyltransferase family 87 protein n=1 Tax=Legionella jordanis TaxID=456 RepID=UPI000F008188|nr:glycosyltransferase family 87 protein [Legionella jordanis]RMX17921.1 DUF2029 domain-containing protein [Legionella jordanis]
MRIGYWQSAVFLITLFIYCGLFYFILSFQQGIDFAAFYSSAQMLTMGNNGYQVLLATYLPVAKKIAANLNPPFFLMLFNPLVKYQYGTALLIWWLISLVASFIGAGLAFHHIFPRSFLKKNWLNLYLIFFVFFGTLMNMTIAQFGGVLLLFVMLGYYFYCKNRDCAAGITWGIIISLKLFPALLFIFALLQKRYKVFWSMFFTTLLLSVAPAFIYGPEVYKDYLSMFQYVTWYGDSWNASLFGFLFRILIDARDKTQSLIWIKLFYLILFAIGLLFYLNKAKKVRIDSQYCFAFTIVMMLFLSPFGWLYYFPVLVFPLALSWFAVFGQEGNAPAKFLWFVSFFLLNFPMDYCWSTRMLTLESRLGIHSLYFYGLGLLIFLMSNSKIKPRFFDSDHYGWSYLPVLYCILGFGFFIPFIGFVGRIFHVNWSNLIS